MGKILAIDYGVKRTGLAVTDDLGLIAFGLTTISTYDLLEFITNYLFKEKVVKIVIGEPKTLDNKTSDVEKSILPFVNHIKKRYKNIEVVRFDERFTSKIAFQTMLSGGLKKKQRQNKGLIDKISATIILQDYLESESIR